MNLQKFKSNPLAGIYIAGIVATTSVSTIYGSIVARRHRNVNTVAYGFVGGVFAGMLGPIGWLMASDFILDDINDSYKK